MRKFIRIALPLAYLAVIIWYLCFDDSIIVYWRWLVGAVGVGAVCYVVLYVRLHKMLSKREDPLNQMAEEAVAKVKGNSLKKEMIKGRLVKEYIKRNPDECLKGNIAIENIKGWLSSLKRCFYITCIIALALLILLIIIAFAFGGSGGTYVPSCIDYHNADDLRKVTGVEFPEIAPVDSFCSDRGIGGYETQIAFVPAKPLDKDFFYRLDQACKTDSCCWRKDSIEYFYHIYPEAIPFDRTKGMHWRMVDVDGKKVPDWDGIYISVSVPIKGDTIILNEGWIR